MYPVNLLFLVAPPGTLTSMAPAFRAADSAPVLAAGCTASRLLLQFSSVFARFNAAVGWPTMLRLDARDDCGNNAVGGTVTLSFSSGDPPLLLADMKNGQYIGTWRPNGASQEVVVTAQGLWNGLQGRATATSTVNSHPDPNAAVFNQGGVVLGAGFERGPIAPGSIVSLFGRNLAAGQNLASDLPLPRQLGGVRVLVGDKEAPLFYAGPQQVNAQVPFELAAIRQLQVVIESNGVASAPEPIQTASTRPGIFALGPPYGNQGAIIIANTNRLAMSPTAGIPSEPARSLGYISIYCTGLGATDPPVASGLPGPFTPLSYVKNEVTAAIDGRPATVWFAGLAPGYVGVYQVNVEVPAGITPGSAVPVVLTQGGFHSNTVTIAVQ